MLDLPAMTLKVKLQEIAKQVKSLGIFGPFHPKFDMLQLFQRELTEMLPPYAHIQASNRVHISLTGIDVAFILPRFHLKLEFWVKLILILRKLENL